jgi:hypothetical protein
MRAGLGHLQPVCCQKGLGRTGAKSPVPPAGQCSSFQDPPVALSFCRCYSMPCAVCGGVGGEGEGCPQLQRLPLFPAGQPPLAELMERSQAAT